MPSGCSRLRPGPAAVHSALAADTHIPDRDSADFDRPASAAGFATASRSLAAAQVPIFATARASIRAPVPVRSRHCRRGPTAPNSSAPTRLPAAGALPLQPAVDKSQGDRSSTHAPAADTTTKVRIAAHRQRRRSEGAIGKDPGRTAHCSGPACAAEIAPRWPTARQILRHAKRR